ncbi:hypothetical protein MSMTP_3065 [Methanosarcina sp. MTP4]|uniref:DUF7289 family protein n=1 Tax=Methanosarcina sp. MTP4 TaxID=1434100 RepID=UPI0006158239|nr:hypothetical protein [Methanosarcina sp. MTP4]AKB26534.1 hypothetical protein MSMTP_3065 [Methanosarcina sp. MTP4]
MNQKAKRKEVAQKSLFKSESAAFTAIAAVLLLGLAFTIISVVKLNYVPEWKIDAEREYSYDAWSDMEEVKTRGDIFTRFMDSDINYPYGLSATVPFGMGGGEIPVFEPSKSNGKLTVNTEECRMDITFGNHAPYTVECGGITYYSENRQYPNQVFRYENGALILAQGENSQMKRMPLFNIKEDMSNYTVTINAINLSGEPASISANTFTALRLTGNRSCAYLNSDVYTTEANESIDSFNLTIYTQYTDAWTTYLNNTDSWTTYLNSTTKKELEYGIDYTIDSTDDYVRLSFLPASNPYNIYFNKTELCAELAGGVLTGGTTPGGYIGEWYFFEKASGNYKGNPITIDTLLLQDYDSTVVLSSGNSPGEELNPYNPTNDFIHNLQYKNQDLDLNFGFHNNTSFESAPTSATVRMIYRYEKSDSELPTLEMGFTGGNSKTIIPRENWSLYEETFSIPPSSNSLSDLNFILTVKTASKNQGTLHIDYLAIRLN